MTQEEAAGAGEAAVGRKGWKARLRAAADKVLHEHASPSRLGAAVGIGVFCGCSPFHGFQFLLTLGLAAALRLNKVAALAGLQISAPPLTPLVIFAGVQCGAWLLEGRFLPLRPSGIRALVHGSLARALLTDFVVGSLVLGVVAGAAAGGLTAAWVRRRRRAGAAHPG